MYKFKYKLFFFLFAISLNAQEFDESFLASLPDDIRRDVIKRADNQDENYDENYSSYQNSSKLTVREELNALKKRLESDLKELEKRLKSDEKLILDDEELKLFGINFFSTFQSSFMPINQPNPDG